MTSTWRNDQVSEGGAASANDWWDKFRLWFKPTGWRPADVAQRFPVAVVEDLAHFKKYETNPSKALLVWSWLQLAATLGLMFFMFNHIASIPFEGQLAYGLFLFAGIFSYTTLLDKNAWAVLAEGIRAVFGLGILWAQGGDWFGLEASVQGGAYGLAAYFLLSFLMTLYFVKTEAKPTDGLPFAV